MDDEIRYERHVKRVFRIPLLVLQPLLLVIWPLSLVSNPLIADPYQLRYLGILVLLLCSVLLLARARSARLMSLAFTGNIWVIAFAFRVQINDCGPLGHYWNLPIALLITLGTCGMTYRISAYLITLAGSWLILFIGLDRLAPATMPGQLVAILVGVTLAIGIAYNYVNSHWMRRTFSLKERYRLMAETDALTGIANRRKLLAQLEEAVRISRDSPCHFAMLDIDNFKAINDLWGHQTGDEVLIALADEISHLDPVLSVGRLGGEEFGILAQGVDQARLDGLLDELRTRLARRPRQAITFSAGVTQAHPGEPITELMRRSDEALYQAKRQGKDRVVWSS
ncbi:GGDEF domain-containing protein [Pseudomonas oryzihabitans]|uniref:GGDEF domain-containing protein n=1 Tax=Pseudomonas oryzihabitans TaxID=47885 RepID=UPI002895CA0C|nr:GGDEF domain-containing protein [Pseudomonas oryzihabitans]MDT3719953.1 GGDEF domain-containing protein [Pseudomonas oryzihabitans]